MTFPASSPVHMVGSIEKISYFPAFSYKTSSLTPSQPALENQPSALFMLNSPRYPPIFLSRPLSFSIVPTLNYDVFVLFSLLHLLLKLAIRGERHK